MTISALHNTFILIITLLSTPKSIQVLPLRGKILNVRGAPPRVLTKNKEITNLVKALGLQFDRKYDGSPLLGKAGMDDPLLYTGKYKYMSTSMSKFSILVYCWCRISYGVLLQIALVLSYHNL